MIFCPNFTYLVPLKFFGQLKTLCFELMFKLFKNICYIFFMRYHFRYFSKQLQKLHHLLKLLMHWMIIKMFFDSMLSRMVKLIGKKRKMFFIYLLYFGRILYCLLVFFPNFFLLAQIKAPPPRTNIYMNTI